MRNFLSIARRILPASLLAAALGWTSAAQAAASLSACPPIPQFKANFQAVAQNVDFSGLPLSIQRFDASMAPSDVLAFYRGAWAGSDKIPGPIEYSVQNWQVIAVFRGGCFYTVQVMAAPKGGSTGFLAVSATPSKGQLKGDVPTMTGSTILNDIAHNDGDGKTARTVLLTNGFSPATNTVFYRNDFTGKGWQVVASHDMTTQTGRGSVTVFRNGMKEVSVVAIREGGGDTQVVLNFVDHP